MSWITRLLNPDNVQYDELWKVVDLLPHGKAKEIALIRFLITSETEEECWEVFWATADESIQDLALGKILTLTSDLEKIRKVYHFGSDQIKLLADVKYDLVSVDLLRTTSVSNDRRRRIATESTSPNCCRMALMQILDSSPTIADLWFVFNHKYCEGKLKKILEYRLASALSPSQLG